MADLDVCNWPRGVTVSTLDSESSDRGSNPREASIQAIVANARTLPRIHACCMVPNSVADV